MLIICDNLNEISRSDDLPSSRPKYFQQLNIESSTVVIFTTRKLAVVKSFVELFVSETFAAVFRRHFISYYFSIFIETFKLSIETNARCHPLISLSAPARKRSSPILQLPGLFSSSGRVEFAIDREPVRWRELPNQESLIRLPLIGGLACTRSSSKMMRLSLD